LRRFVWPVSKARRKAGQSKRRAALPGEQFFNFAASIDENLQWNQWVIWFLSQISVPSFCANITQERAFYRSCWSLNEKIIGQVHLVYQLHLRGK
jgi:hypothetical protein